jgi:hypothetical protein
MAKFTYTDFENEARKAGLLDKFSAADLKLAKENPDAGLSILNYKKDYLSATTDEMRAAANAGAENIRSQYGNYTGGQFGDQYYLNGLSPQDYDAPVAPSFDYADAPTYDSRYDAQIQQQMQDILNRPAFSYDAENDPLYGQYRKQYAREGQRATQDALGAAAAATGGMPSSYAMTAAAQAGNYYAAQAADIIPELYDKAYNQYLNDFNMQLSGLEVLRGAEESDYMKFQDELNQFNTDRNFDYAGHLDRLSQQNNERDFAYKQLIDEINQQAYEKEAGLNKAIDAASFGDFSLLERQGITPDLAALQAAASGESNYENDFMPAEYNQEGSAVDEEAVEEIDASVITNKRKVKDGVEVYKVGVDWLTLEELNDAVDNGEITETIADGKYTYTWTRMK